MPYRLLFILGGRENRALSPISSDSVHITFNMESRDLKIRGIVRSSLLATANVYVPQILG